MANPSVFSTMKPKPIQTTNSTGYSSSQISEQLRVKKPTIRDLNKKKRSIKLIHEFTSTKYLTYPENHPNYIPNYIRSQLTIDFWNEYP